MISFWSNFCIEIKINASTSFCSHLISGDEAYNDAIAYGRDGGDCSYYSDESDCKILEKLFRRK